MGYWLKILCVCRTCLWDCESLSVVRLEVYVELLQSVNVELELIASDIDFLMLLRSGNSVFVYFGNNFHNTGIFYFVFK